METAIMGSCRVWGFRVLGFRDVGFRDVGCRVGIWDFVGF